jgi:hypothetical protein
MDCWVAVIAVAVRHGVTVLVIIGVACHRRAHTILHALDLCDALLTDDAEESRRLETGRE